MPSSKKIYSWEEDTKAVAFLDIIGFSSLSTIQSPDDTANESAIFTYFENCILPNLGSMEVSAPREVPTDAENAEQKASFWHESVPLGSVNFVYLSDSAVLYSQSLRHLFQELATLMGGAITFAVPIRGAITIGSLHHSEWLHRPQTAICIYGQGLSRAVAVEKSVKGACMTIWLDDPIVTLAKTLGLDQWIVQRNNEPPQLKWWEFAFDAPRCRDKKESSELQYFFDRWFTEKHTKHWFKDPHSQYARNLVQAALSELRSKNR